MGIPSPGNLTNPPAVVKGFPAVYPALAPKFPWTDAKRRIPPFNRRPFCQPAFFVA